MTNPETASQVKANIDEGHALINYSHPNHIRKQPAES